MIENETFLKEVKLTFSNKSFNLKITNCIVNLQVIQCRDKFHSAIISKTLKKKHRNTQSNY